MEGTKYSDLACVVTNKTNTLELSSKIYIKLIIIIAAIAVVYIWKRHHRKQELSQLIIRLEEYKNRHGLYPADLETIGINDDELEYTTDSSEKNFDLSFTQGFMEVNTVVYTNETGKWDTSFNY